MPDADGTRQNRGLAKLDWVSFALNLKEALREVSSSFLLGVQISGARLSQNHMIFRWFVRYHQAPLLYTRMWWRDHPLLFDEASRGKVGRKIILSRSSNGVKTAVI